MKQLTIIFVLVGLTFNGMSQENEVLQRIAALKLKNNLKQTKELAESILQYENILEQSKILKEMNDMYKEISVGVKKYTPVSNSFGYMYRSVDLYKDIVVELDRKKQTGTNPYTKDQLRRLDKTMISLLDSNIENISDLKMIMSKGKVKMNDGERMEIAAKIEKRTYYNYKKMERINSIICKKYYLF